MTDYDYRYQEPVNPGLTLFPEGDYPYIVAGLVSEPYTTNNGNFVLPLKLAVGPEKLTIWDYPSAGKTKNDQPYDSIAPFLKSCGRNPKPGERPDLTEQALKGARGMCHLKVIVSEGGSMKGKEVNKVAYYIWGSTPDQSSKPVPVKKAFEPSVVDEEPDDIPF
jgi:hypothetical protein